MTTFIIAALTADGFIAKDAGHSPFNWTSKEDKARFIRLTKEAGVVVLGSATFATFPKPLKDRRNIIYSRTKTFAPPEGSALVDGYPLVETTQESPADLVKRLESEQAKAIAISGGSQIYTAFMKAGVVDKLFLTVEPVVFGSGIRVFSESLDFKLRLVSSETTPTGTIFLDYEVIK